MIKRYISFFALLTILLGLTGCAPNGTKTASVSIIYGISALLSFFLWMGYCFFIKRKERWFVVLFTSVFVVNIGYFILSISGNLNMALQANRISYLGSVFLPLSMLMTILKVSNIRYKTWLPTTLIVVGFLVFLIAASPGYSTIYYQDVSFEIINGVGTLIKVYGPWHFIYMVYLLSYFVVMSCIVLQIALQKKLEKTVNGFILLFAVFINLGVWFVEQFVEIDFEALALSYIISEFFLLLSYLIIEENKRLKTIVSETVSQIATAENTNTACDSDGFLSEKNFEQFTDGLKLLTPTEHKIFDYYIDGAGTKDILVALNITENTLKFHNKNIYSKLGVSSRKKLIETYKQIEVIKKLES